MDFDYAKKLEARDRQWLAAFAEEYYKGFYQKKETQVTPLEVRRAACAARKRVREHKEPLVFPAERQALARELHAEQPRNVEDEVICGIDRRRHMDEADLAILEQRPAASPAGPLTAMEVVQRFCEEHELIPGNARSVPVATLYRCFLAWAVQAGIPPPNAFVFIRKMGRIGFHPKRERGAAAVKDYGMKLAPSARTMRRWALENPEPYGWSEQWALLWRPATGHRVSRKYGWTCMVCRIQGTGANFHYERHLQRNSHKEKAREAITTNQSGEVTDHVPRDDREGP